MAMYILNFVSTWDTLVLTVPFLAILGLGMLGLDEKVATPKQDPRPRRAFCGLDKRGRPVLSDPDGNPSYRGGARQIESKIEKAVEAD